MSPSTLGLVASAHVGGALATFGTDDETGTSTGGLADAVVATKYTLTEDGTLLALHYYAKISGNVKYGVHADNAGVPGALIVANNTGVAVTGPGWNEVEIDDTALSAGDYWLSFLDDTSSMRGWKAGGSNQASYVVGVGYSNGIPSPFGTPSGYQNNDYICYATYEVTA